MSVIAVFPQKTGDSMFVGFDSQNTSHSFPHYPNWDLWVSGIFLIGFRGWSERGGEIAEMPGFAGLAQQEEK